MSITSTSGILACVAGCGHTTPMRSPAYYNRVGWPRCCGLTMEWRAQSTAGYSRAMRHAVSGKGHGFVTTSGNSADLLEEAVERAAEQGGEL